MQCLHDDGDEGQVELSDVGSDLWVRVARVCIMAAQQGVNSTNGLFMKEENSVGKKGYTSTIVMFLTAYVYFILYCNHTYGETKSQS